MRQLKKIKTIRWVARIGSILVFIFAIALLFTQLLSDSGEAPTTLYWMLFGLWFFAVLSLLVCWRWEIAGSVLAIIALISREMAYFYLSGEILENFWMVWLPVLIPALLFTLAWREERKFKEAQKPRDIYD